MPLVCTCVFHHGKSIYPGLKDDIQLSTEIFAIICLISVPYVTESSDFVTLDLLQSNLMEYWHSYQIWCAEQLFHKKLIIKIICNSNISYFFLRLTVAEVLLMLDLLIATRWSRPLTLWCNSMYRTTLSLKPNQNSGSYQKNSLLILNLSFRFLDLFNVRRQIIAWTWYKM